MADPAASNLRRAGSGVVGADSPKPARNERGRFATRQHFEQKTKKSVMKRQKMLITHLLRRVREGRQSDGGKGSALRICINPRGATPDSTDRKEEASYQRPLLGDSSSRQRLECNWVDVCFSIRLHTLWPSGFPMNLTVVGTSRRDVPARAAAGGRSGLRR